MKKSYITLVIIAISLIFLSLMLFIDIPSPSSTIVETYNLEVE